MTRATPALIAGLVTLTLAAATAQQNSAPNIAHGLGGETALDVIAVAEMLGSWNFLLDATYGSSTYQDIDSANVYYVYRTQTGIITRFEPRPLPAEGKPLEINVNAACGAEAPVWERVTTWTDDRVQGVIDIVD